MPTGTFNGKRPGSQPYANGRPSGGNGHYQTAVAQLPILTAGELVASHPNLRPPLIDGLLRQGETANIIAPPKAGKSWLTDGLAAAVATGRHWLGLYATRRSDVLLIDNELHPETIAHRLPKVAAALDIPFAELAEHISVVPLRGRLQDLHALKPGLLAIERGRFGLVVVDAMYRVLPTGTDENDNAMMADLYNVVDSVADALGASFAFVHHASKGDQSAKAVTDVGSGAGSLSRAADTHI